MTYWKAVRDRRGSAIVGLALAVGALALALLLPAPTEAIPCGFEYRYYSDGTYTTIVGRAGNRPQECGCTTYSSGRVTIYRKSGASYCIEV